MKKILTPYPTSNLQAQSNSIEIWMRAFIPNPQNAGASANFIKQLPDGGSSVSLHYFDSSFPVPNICFATDDRGFSSDPTMTSRLETKFTLSLSPDGTGTVSTSPGGTTSSVTKKVDCKTGAVLDHITGSIDRDHIGIPAVADGTVQVLGQVQGTNMLTGIGAAGPSIDYSYDVQWNPSISTVTVKVTIASFPAFELYIRQPNGVWQPIIRQLPNGTPWALGTDGYGIFSLYFDETKTVTGLNGIFKTPLPEQRFTLDIQGKKVKWTEKNTSGATLTKEVRIIELTDGKLKIERPNTDDVLAFLGFQPSLRAEITAQKPDPSFMVIYRNSDKLIAEWNGLTATKDNNAHLKELIQPGSRPAKIYDLIESP